MRRLPHGEKHGKEQPVPEHPDLEAVMGANPDFEDLLNEFNAAKVSYLVVGAHAVIHHTEPRYTRDMDVWAEPTSVNAAHAWVALARFGAPLKNLAPSTFWAWRISCGPSWPPGDREICSM